MESNFYISFSYRLVTGERAIGSEITHWHPFVWFDRYWNKFPQDNPQMLWWKELTPNDMIALRGCKNTPTMYVLENL
jgi:hypothetical protein